MSVVLSVVAFSQDPTAVAALQAAVVGGGDDTDGAAGGGGGGALPNERGGPTSEKDVNGRIVTCLRS